MLRGPPYTPAEDADILATLSPTPVRMAALRERTGRTPAALRKRYQRLRGGGGDGGGQAETKTARAAGDGWDGGAFPGR